MTPEGVLFEGETKAVRSTNESGEFSILPLHANFITIIKDRVELYKEKGKPEVFSVDEGVLCTKENIVDIFTNITGNSRV